MKDIVPGLEATLSRSHTKKAEGSGVNFLIPYTMELDLRKSDITLIGHTVFGVAGSLCIVVEADDPSAGVKEILLRNILKLFGQDHIVKEIWEWDTDDDEIIDTLVFATTLPIEEYEAICEQEE